MSDSLKIAEYRVLLTELKTRIHAAQYAALRAVNKELLALYWDIGKLIEERQEAEGWGKAVVERLSADLRAEFGEKSGFSVQNLWYMRKFYREYKGIPNLQPLAGEIAWTKNTLILDRCQNPLQREFYLRATARFGWTRRVLEHQIDNQTYEKYLLNQTSFDSALPQAIAAQAKLAVKDHYTFDFLELSDAHEERELEAALLANVQHFLAEMGPHFTFVGSQYRLVVEGNDYYIDLLLYHRTLKSLIAIELKIGEFQPEHKGKMEFYLVALNEQVKLPDENDAIGIISLFTATVVEGELLYGARLLPEGARRTTLLHVLQAIFNDDFAGRVMSFDRDAADAYAQLVSTRRAAGKPISQFDAMIAAIALTRGAALATRNTKDFVDCGIVLINPWMG